MKYKPYFLCNYCNYYFYNDYYLSLQTEKRREKTETMGNRRRGEREKQKDRQTMRERENAGRNIGYTYIQLCMHKPDKNVPFTYEHYGSTYAPNHTHKYTHAEIQINFHLPIYIRIPARSHPL